MKEPTSDEERSIQVDQVVCRSLEFDDRLDKDDASVCSLSRNKFSLQKMPTVQLMALNGSKRTDAKRCIRKSYIEKHCDNDLTIQNWRSIYDFQLAQYVDGFSEFRSPDSPRIICRSPSRFHIPLNLSSSSFLFDGVKTRRRTRSTNDLGNFIVEYASSDGQKNIFINPYTKWIIDATEGNEKARDIMRQSLLLSLGELGSNLRLNRGMPVITRETKSPKQKILPNRRYYTSPQKSKLDMMPPNEQKYALVASDDMSQSCSSSISTGSSANCTTSKGFLHSLWEGGIPYFVFMANDEEGDIYVANPWKVSSSDDKTLDYMYLFHSCNYPQKSMARFRNHRSDLVGKMTVSSSFSFNSNRSRFMETEFVLFGATEEHAREMHKSYTFLKNCGLPKKMTDIFRLSCSSKRKFGSQKSSQNTFEEFFLDVFDKTDGQDLIQERPPPNLELAAIVIKEQQPEPGKEAMVGGWGLKFLGNATIDHTDVSTQTSFSPTTCHRNSRGEKTGQSKSIDVLVPAGFHGGPLTKIRGPSSLTKRWRSGGHCDCGGWDLGCPLTVLNSRSIDMPTMTSQDNPQEDHRPLDLFTEGAKKDEPVLRMVNMQEGSYFVHFQSNLSALQSFSIAVALIHAQTPGVRESCV